MLALYPKEKEGNFVSRLNSCFAAEQTDDALIAAVNAVYYHTGNLIDLYAARDYMKENRCFTVGSRHKNPTRFFSEYVDVAIGERDGIKRKPAPDTVEQALRELDSTKEESVYVGDSEVDLQTAKNAGIPCIAVLWGFRDRAFLEEKGATLFAERPEDIVEML